jgi:RND family efflux transporter MFP subunit
MVARSVISAPFAGVAASVDLEVGEVAPPGAPLIRIVQTDPIVVSVSLSDRDLASIEVGMTASVSTDAIGGVRSGKVAHIRPAADLNTRSFTAEVSVDNADGRLMPGMIASVRLERAAGSKQMVLAQDWLVTKPNQLGVFIHDEGVARWRAVETGQVVGDRVIVASGLSGGDELVVTGHRELVDGDPLIVARRGTCCREGRVFYDEAKR